MSWNTIPEHERAELRQRLTQKQLDVLILWHAGLGYTKIAAGLGVSVRTIRTHLARARQIHDRIHQEAA